GTTISVDTLPTSESRFRHVKTSSFEAIELHARESNMIVILPDESQTAEGVIHMLESDPSSIEDSMTYERGDLRMPSFHIVKDVELKPVLEKMGLKSSFQRLTFVTAIEGGWLTTVASKVDVQVDKEGMRADA